MRIWHVRTAAAVIALTALACVVAAAGDAPIRETPEPYVPSRSELVEIGMINAHYPIPGQLPPEVFPPEAFGLGPPSAPPWLPWLLGAIGAAAIIALATWLLRRRPRIHWRRPRLGGWRRRSRPGPSPAIKPARVIDDEAAVAREAVDAALAPLREPTDP